MSSPTLTNNAVTAWYAKHREDILPVISLMSTIVGFVVMGYVEYLIDMKAFAALNLPDDLLLSLVLVVVILPHMHFTGELLFKLMNREFEGKQRYLSRDSARKLVRGLAWGEVAARVLVTWALIYLWVGDDAVWFPVLASISLIAHGFYLKFYAYYIEANYAENGYEPEGGLRQNLFLFATLSLVPAVFQTLLILSASSSTTGMLIALVAVGIGFIGGILNLYLNHKSDLPQGSEVQVGGGSRVNLEMISVSLAPMSFTAVSPTARLGSTSHQGSFSEEQDESPREEPVLRRAVSAVALRNSHSLVAEEEPERSRSPGLRLFLPRSNSDGGEGDPSSSLTRHGPRSRLSTPREDVPTGPGPIGLPTDGGTQLEEFVFPESQSPNVSPRSMDRSREMAQQSPNHDPAANLPEREPLPWPAYVGLAMVDVDIILYFVVTDKQGSYDSMHDSVGDAQDFLVSLYALATILSVTWLYVSALRRQYKIYNPFESCTRENYSQVPQESRSPTTR